MGGSVASICDILSQNYLFEGIPRSDIIKLADRVQTRVYQKKQPIFAMGDPGDCMMAVLSGQIGIRLYSPEGRDVLLAIFGPGAVFGEIAMIDGGERTADADALTTTELIVLHRRDFMPFVDRNPKVAMRLLDIMCKRFRAVDKQILDFFTLSLPSRIAKTLLVLADNHGRPTKEGTEINLYLPQQLMASMALASRESVNQVFKDLEHAGCIKKVSRCRYEITDREMLEQQAAIAV